MAAKPWDYFVHPDDIERTRRETTALYSGQDVINFENRYRHKDGTCRWLGWRAKFDRESGHIYAGAVDITGREDVEEEKERFFDIASDILVTASQDSRFVKVNSAVTPRPIHSARFVRRAPWAPHGWFPRPMRGP